MSEPHYPRAWATRNADGWCGIYDSVRDAERERYPGEEVVELVPMPEVQRLIADAVAAEREACKGIAKTLEYALGEKCGKYRPACRLIAYRIRERGKVGA